MHWKFFLSVVALSLSLLWGGTAEAMRVKDVGQFYGKRENQLTGTGLVVGLTRTGDTQRNQMSIRTLANRLQGLGLNLEMQDIISRNIALVMVTAELSPDARPGSRLDVTVASSGDATSLEGGQLLMTPLYGADGEVYAVASGALVIGGFSVESEGSSTRKNITTVGRVSDGALVEAELPRQINYNASPVVEWILNDPDFTTAVRVAGAINDTFGAEITRARDSGTLVVKIPEKFKGNFALFASIIEAVEVDIDLPARVVVNERTGTVVMGSEVTISPVAVAHGGLTIEVQRNQEASQPGALSGGNTVVIRDANVNVEEADGEVVMLDGVTIGELVSALNDMGVNPRDLIVILQTIRAAGALHAELVTL